ncbi:hypothetical protein EfmAA610_32840 (plasmid) [Enterococcus faecium]|nr:hypothetical protein EfmAA610_32840 [Enterococcus faecium]
MFPGFYTGLFSTSANGEKIYGTLNAIQVFCEALMMGIVPIIMRKLGVIRITNTFPIREFFSTIKGN